MLLIPWFDDITVISLDIYHFKGIINIFRVSPLQRGKRYIGIVHQESRLEIMKDWIIRCMWD